MDGERTTELGNFQAHQQVWDALGIRKRKKQSNNLTKFKKGWGCNICQFKNKIIQ